MVRRRAAVTPFLVLGTAVLLGGWFLQEGVEREENLYIQVRVFQEVVERVADEFVEQVDRGSLYESAIEGLLDRLDDPNSSFISARAYEEFEIRTTSGEYGGVGLEVVERDGHVTVVAPVPGTPGARSGIRPGDWFVEIEGENAEGWPVDRAVQVLRGEPGSSVQVKMGRAGVDEPIPFTLTRDVIHLRSVPFSLVLEGGVGYVPLQIFRTTSSDEVRVALDSLVAEGIESVILDLRGNPGGLLEEGIGVAELFLGRGAAIAETRGRGRGQSRAFQASVDAAYPDLPLLVLVDGASASASEIVAGALQDHDRGVVVGLPTYGKGSVQTLFRLSGGNVLRLTTARWYTPVGRSIEREREEQPSPGEASLSLGGGLLLEDDEGDRPLFQSMGGRELRGGGGIVPDTSVAPDTLTAAEALAVRALYQRAGALNAALFSFAVDYVRAHPELETGFALEADVLDAFRRHARERELELDAGTLERARRFVTYQLEREIAHQKLGEPGEFLQMRRYDRQLEVALALLASADDMDELLQVAGRGLPTTRPGAASDSPGR
jgi:carboxyl-terminal processing protease